MGLASAAALVIANMIGAGVFTTSGFALGDLGDRSFVLAAWLIGGIVAMCGALSYGAFARRMPESGGEYTFLSRAVHPLAGFLAGWVSLLAGFTAPIAAAAHGLQAYLGAALPEGSLPIEGPWIGTAAILGAGAMHGVRLREGVALQNVAVGLKLFLLAGFVVAGAVAMRGGSLAGPDAPVAGFALGPFAVTLVWISFSYSGWNAAVYIAGEVRDPERNLARSLWLATAVVTCLYLALNAVFIYSAPVALLAGRPEVGAIAAEAIGGASLRAAVSGVVALALFTSISSMVMVGPRVYARMADDGLFPAAFRFEGAVPTRAILLQVGLALCVLWISTLRELLGYIGFTLGISSAATVVALLVLRRREGAEGVPIPGFPWVPLTYVVVTATAALFMAQREPGEAGLGVVTVALGVPFYFWMRRSSRA